MPRWVAHSKSFLDWRKRFRLNTDPTEVLTGILPTATVDRHWPRDVTDVWGAFGQGLTTANGQFGAVELVAQRRRLRVHRVTAWEEIPGQVLRGRIAHMFTPVQAYDPTAIGTTIWFPWLQCGYRPTQAAYLADAFLFGGAQTALQVVTVNGVPFTTIGPAMIHGGTILAGNQYVKDTEHVLWDSQDPPLFVQPFTSLCVQSEFVSASPLYGMNVSFFFSEEDVEE